MKKNNKPESDVRSFERVILKNFCLTSNLCCKIAGLLYLTVSGSGVLYSAHSQNTIADTDIELYSLSGDISLQGNAYTTTQDVDRREPLGFLGTTSLNYSFLGIQSGLDLRYSTDDNQFRQTVNRFSFYGSWRWIRLSAGDVSPAYSNYSIRGTMLRGGELALTPGNFMFKVAAGRANRLTRGGVEDDIFPRTFEYERRLYGGLIGYGQENRSFIRLTALYGKDDTASLPDTTGANLPQTLGLLPPAENLSITPDFQLSFLDDAIRIRAEATASAYTYDTNSPVLNADEAGVPAFLTNIFSPRNSTRLSFAGMAETEFNVDAFNTLLSYERIQPGFESMGIRMLRDDQQTITVRPSANFMDNRLHVNGTFSMSKDNLTGNRISTQKNNNLALNTNYQVTGSFRLGAGYSRFSSVTEQENTDEAGFNQLSQVFQLMPGISWAGVAASHNVMLAVIYQMLTSELPVSDGLLTNTSNTLTSTLNYTLALQSGLSVNGSANFVSGEATSTVFSSYGANAGLGYNFFNNKVNAGINAGVMINEFENTDSVAASLQSTMQINGNAMLTYNIAQKTSLNMNVRFLDNSMVEGDGIGFSEVEGRIKLTQRF